MSDVMNPMPRRPIHHRPNRTFGRGSKPYVRKDANWRPESAPIDEKLLTLSDVTLWFSVGDKTIRRWVLNDGFPAYRGPSGKVYCVRSEVVVWMEQRFMRAEYPAPVPS